MTELPPTDLDRIPDLQGWNQDGHHQGDILLHGAVLGDQQHEGEHKRNHLGVTELQVQSRQDPQMDHTLERGSQSQIRSHKYIKWSRGSLPLSPWSQL